MKNQENLIRMKELIKLINKHNEAYYELDAPIISDAEYDSLYDELILLENVSGIVLDNSPTKKVGGNTKNEFVKYTHKSRLYSLDKCKSSDELLSWYEKCVKAVGKEISCTVEYKYDGLTLNLTYDNGKLTKGATRGNGEIGELVTDQVKTIRKLPHKINDKDYMEIQGEGIMRLSTLKMYNEDYNNVPLKNVRNGAAGGIRNLNSKVTAKRNLDIFCYNIGYHENLNLKTQEDIYNYLNILGIPSGEYFKICHNFNEINNAINEIEKMRDTLDFEIDGAVIKINNLEDREILGYTEKFPKWAIAYKFKAQEATTIVKNVIFQVSRTGKLNPLAIVEPVSLSGAMVSKATLSNISEIQRKDIKIGSKVFIRRSNDVIPEILGVAEKLNTEKEIEIPTNCPVCGSMVERNGVFLYCSNKENCKNQIIKKIVHFASKACMNIEGLSDKTVEALYDELNVKNFSDLYKLTENDLLNLDNFKDKKANNIIKSIEKSKKVQLAAFLNALGIENIGHKSTKQLAEKFKSIENIKNATFEDLLSIEDFGDIMADCVIKYFKNENNLNEIGALLNNGITIIATERGSLLNGLKFIITGTLESYKRNEIEKIIIDNGGDILTSVSKNLDYLICGSDAGSKLDKAKKLNISILSENDFIAMLNK